MKFKEVSQQLEETADDYRTLFFTYRVAIQDCQQLRAAILERMEDEQNAKDQRLSELQNKIAKTDSEILVAAYEKEIIKLKEKSIVPTEEEKELYTQTAKEAETALSELRQAYHRSRTLIDELKKAVAELKTATAFDEAYSAWIASETAEFQKMLKSC